MKVFTSEVVCAVCGGEGMACPRDAAQEWLGAEMVHIDPRDCQDHLRQREIELRQREEVLGRALEELDFSV